MIPAIPMPTAAPTDAPNPAVTAAEGAEGTLTGLFVAALAAVTSDPESPIGTNSATTESMNPTLDADELPDPALLVDPVDVAPEPIVAPVPAPPPVPVSTPTSLETGTAMRPNSAGPGARLADVAEATQDGEASADGGGDGGSLDLAEPEAPTPFRDPTAGAVRDAPEAALKPAGNTPPTGDGARVEASSDAAGAEPVLDVEAPAEPKELSEPRVRVRGLDRARVDVPLPGGDRVRAEVSVQEGIVDVRLDTGAELGAAAVREIDALRDGLADQGLDLGDLDFGELDREEEEPEHEHAENSTNRSEEETATRPWRRSSSDDDPTRGAFVRRTM